MTNSIALTVEKIDGKELATAVSKLFTIAKILNVHDANGKGVVTYPNENGFIATYIVTETKSDILTSSNSTTNGSFDLDGTELILDADADTSITADTDDQIDIKVAGADDFKITANTFTALSGSTIATNTITETTAASGVTVAGALIRDGVFGNVSAITATLGGASIASGTQSLTVTSSDANHIVFLPYAALGMVIKLYVGANGFELRPKDSSNSINGGSGAGAESAIPANTFVIMEAASTSAWIGRQYTTAGVESAVQVAAA